MLIMDTTNNTAAAETDTAARRTARCATCGGLFEQRNEAHIHCSAECRRLAARLGGLRDAADAILAETASTNRARAIYRLRRMLVSAVTEGAQLPDASEKADRHDDGSDRRRRWCSVCGADLGEVAGRGRPAHACKADTGRSCARFRNRCQEVASLATAIAAVAPNAERARRAMARTVAEINTEIGL
jgi:hypothetical protein